MSSITRNSLTNALPQLGFVAFQTVQDAVGTTLTLANQSGLQIFQSDVTLTRNSIGNYSLAVANFRGTQGSYNVALTVNTTGVDCTVQAGVPSYSSSVLTVPILTFTAGVAADCGVFGTVLAY
jgi:hypothetical protein